ncbi:MAG TPA: hypothetical protein VM282_00200 [Acidimicrobiales bacterium]|nr:hypothetical protein [Acidimicrobiales bacterium]
MVMGAGTTIMARQGPDMYLGLVYVRSRRLPLRFVLDFSRR